ncbi:transmembrane protein 234 homolog [Trichoderma asperellum]|uniref:Transmembrane protein 234 homolog n=1 Tax=Trichoderma asperellum TaxID=101201 RepID=A0A6V8QJM5_TRIAP|nr:transmembrane protein 234 homolog [Trichoderma asperellum]
MPSDNAAQEDQQRPPAINYILSFILVGLAWGLTTPFIRRAARAHKPPSHAILARPAVQASWLRHTLYGAFFAVVDLLRNPRYAVPLVLNLTGSVWFFLLIGKADPPSSSPPIHTRTALPG